MAVVVGRAKETLLTEAANFDPLGPWHVVLFGHGDDPSPTVKKKCLSTVWGTFAGNLELAKLLSFLVKLETNNVELKSGSVGLCKGRVSMWGEG